MKVGDLVRFGSDEEVINGLRQLGAQLGLAGSLIPVQDKSDYLGFALRGLVAYASELLTRMASLYNAGIEVHAWIARNLFEVSLLCEYVLTDPVRAKEFVSQKASDELQINEGFLALSDDPADPARRPILQRNDHIRRTMARHAVTESRPWAVSHLARVTGNDAEYDAFFKLYSKYVHPSSWLAFAAPGEADTPVLRNVFLVQTQYHGAKILRLAQDFPLAHGT